MADTSSSDDFASLRYPGGEIDLKIARATEGSDGIELGPLLAKTGYTTFDGGFVNTASCKSAITYIDGDAGILRYRGYPIEQLAEKSTFIEVSYLLIYGELPTPEQLENFTTQIQRHTLLHEDLKRFFDGFPRNAHPMPVLSSAANALLQHVVGRGQLHARKDSRKRHAHHHDHPKHLQQHLGQPLARGTGKRRPGLDDAEPAAFVGEGPPAKRPIKGHNRLDVVRQQRRRDPNHGHGRRDLHQHR